MIDPIVSVFSPIHRIFVLGLSLDYCVNWRLISWYLRIARRFITWWITKVIVTFFKTDISKNLLLLCRILLIHNELKILSFTFLSLPWQAISIYEFCEHCVDHHFSGLWILIFVQRLFYRYMKSLWLFLFSFDNFLKTVCHVISY